MRLNKRIAQLERGTPRLSARAKAWLGWPVTDLGDDDDCEDFDTRTLSMEARAWLGID